MFKGVQRRLSRGFSRAGEMLTGVGPTPTKQFKNAIIDGDEDKAISIYTSTEGDKCLLTELDPSKPFPTKKSQQVADTPMHLSTKFGLIKLLIMLLERGGDPRTLNSRGETCLHSVCSEGNIPETRAAILNLLMQWRSNQAFRYNLENKSHMDTSNRDNNNMSNNNENSDNCTDVACASQVTEKLDAKQQQQGQQEQEQEQPQEEVLGEGVSLNQVDVDGNTAIHCAARSGLLHCVEKLVALGAIISIVNKDNATCCEIADEGNHKELASMLELALVFQPIDESMAEFEHLQAFPFDNQPGKLFLDCESLSTSGVNNFIEAAVADVTQQLLAINPPGCANGAVHVNDCEAAYTQRIISSRARARAEALLINYSWNVTNLLQELAVDPLQVLAKAKLSTEAPNISHSDAIVSDPAAAADTGGGSSSSNGSNSDVADSVAAEGAVLKADGSNGSGMDAGGMITTTNDTSESKPEAAATAAATATIRVPTPVTSAEASVVDKEDMIENNPPASESSSSNSNSGGGIGDVGDDVTYNVDFSSIASSNGTSDAAAEATSTAVEKTQSAAPTPPVLESPPLLPPPPPPAATTTAFTTASSDAFSTNDGIAMDSVFVQLMDADTSAAPNTDAATVSTADRVTTEPELNRKNDSTTICNEKENSLVMTDIREPRTQSVTEVAAAVAVLSDTKSTDLPAAHLDDVTVSPLGACAICGEEMLREVPDVFRFIRGQVVGDTGRRQLSCGSGHAFCVDCWSGHLGVQVSDNGVGSLPCPGFKCGEILDLQWAPVVLQTQEMVNRVRMSRQRLAIDCCNALKPCPIQNCGLVVGVEALPTVANGNTASTVAAVGSTSSCAICDNGHLFCVLCSEEAHAPCSCEQRTQWLQLVQDELKDVGGMAAGSRGSSGAGGGDNDDLANALWVAANTKRCPRCQTAIEKDEGCNHMCCRKCRKEFCWICMQDWSLHSDATGGYFQCNRFITQPVGGTGEDGSGGSGGVMGGRDIWAEERGNAHAETLRLRERNRRMARFLHHFTRFQAHMESVRLEFRMRGDTLARITTGLKSSLPTASDAETLFAATTATGASAASNTTAASGGSKGEITPRDEQAGTMSLEPHTSPAAATAAATTTPTATTTTTTTTPGDSSRKSIRLVRGFSLASSVGKVSGSSGSNSTTGSGSTRNSKVATGKMKWLQGDRVANPMAEAMRKQQEEQQEQLEQQQQHQQLQQEKDSAAFDGGNTTAAAAAVTVAGSGSQLSQHSLHRSSSVVLTASSLAFLREGFEELLKCRALLQWSYPYAYYEFDKNDNHDYTGTRHDPRNRTWGRSFVEDHRSSFELLQSDLEAFIETLSDVVARRRLRAGHSQISLATRAARSKRIELESLLVAFAMSKIERNNRAMNNAANSGQRSSAGHNNRGSNAMIRSQSNRNRSSGYHRSRHAMFTLDRNEAGTPPPTAGHYFQPELYNQLNHMQRRNHRHRAEPDNEDMPLHRSDSEDSFDLATLLYELELAALREEELRRTHSTAAEPAPAPAPSAAPTSKVVSTTPEDSSTGPAVENNVLMVTPTTTLAAAAVVPADASDVSSTPTAADAVAAAERIAHVTDRIDELQERMRRLFGATQDADHLSTSTAASTSAVNNDDLPPPLPSGSVPSANTGDSSRNTPGGSVGGSATNSGRRNNSAGGSGRRRRARGNRAAGGGTPSPARRTFSLRTARNSSSPSISAATAAAGSNQNLSGGAPGAAPTFSIDSDFSFDDSDEDDDVAAADGEAASDGMDVASYTGPSAAARVSEDETDDENEAEAVNTPIRVPGSSSSGRNVAPVTPPSASVDGSSATTASSTPNRINDPVTVASLLRLGAAAAASSGGNDNTFGNTGSSVTASSRDSRRMARMARRAEEEAALNRAILMSLQESSVTNTAPATASATAASGANNIGDNSADGDNVSPAASGDGSGVLNEESVQMLLGMGFEREQAIQALRESRMNVELAANRLLGIDF